MESAPPTTAAGGGGGGGPAPFLLKTYDMVDDSSTDEIVSWSSNKSSFVVWNPPEFARLLLPTYFKHNNFSSFIRQLNTYGFRKIDPEKWEFANEDFVKDQKHLLKNIHRRKPIHSHSNPPAGSVVDQERASLDEELEKLKEEKAALEAQVLQLKQQCPAVLDLEDLTQRIESIQQRQDKLLAILEKAVQDPSFVEYVAQKFESLDFSVYNKKRRLPQIDQSKPVAENSFVENHRSCRPESGNVIHQDFSNKLKLELSPAVSDINLVSHSTQSSNEDEGSPQRKLSEGVSKDVETRTSCLPCAPETLELSDTGTSYTFKVDPVLQRKLPANESPGLHLLQLNLTSNEDIDAHTSCHLNLTLASSPLQLSRSPYSARTPQLGQENGKTLESRFNVNSKESDLGVVPKNRNLVDGDATMTSLQEAPNCKEGPAAPPVRVNDVFWEQFLTERPGSADNEEASSHYRANPYEEQQDKRSNRGMRRNTKSMEHLSL